MDNLKRLFICLVISSLFALVLFPKKWVVFADPPSSGDWVVTMTENYDDEVIVLNGNLIVENGGNLTFRKVTLKMNCTYNGQYNITVMTGGAFYVLEGSVLTSANPDKRIGVFNVWPDSTFRMSDSELHECGSVHSAPGPCGLKIHSGDAIIENSVISHNTYGINILSDGVVIRNNTITANAKGIVIHQHSSANISDNYISLNNGTGIEAHESSSPTIHNNLVTLNNGTGIGTYGGSSIIYNNTVTLNNERGIDAFDGSSIICNNTIKLNNERGIRTHDGTPTVYNNLISSNNGTGIEANGGSPTIYDNIIKSNNKDGISTGEGSPTIYNNTITLNIEQGIRTYRGSPKIYGNTITSNNGMGVGVNEGISTIYDNLISLNTEQGIGTHKGSPTILNNTITSNLGQGIIFGYEANAVIQGNIITLNKHSGILGQHNCSLLIQGNNMTSNNGTGITVVYNCTGVIQGNIITSNMDSGIICTNNSLPEIHWNDIYGNEGAGVANGDPSVIVNATYNYWGDGPSTSSHVLYDPWLTESILYAEITSPLSSDVVSSTVTVSTRVNAQNGVQKVEFYIDDQLEYTDENLQYEWNWDTTQHTETEHKIIAKAYDTFGLKTSKSITVLVDNTPPIVSIKEPKQDPKYSGIINVSVNATDKQEIDNVHVRVDATEWLVMIYDPTALLWKCDLNTTTLSDGQHILHARASDKVNNTATTSTPFFIDNNPPTLIIQTPQSGTTVGLTLIVEVQANDTSGISRIEFYLHQDLLVHTVTNTPYQWSWDTTQYANGEYTITVKAYDPLERVTTSETTVTIRNAESPWWQTHFWTIIQVVVAIGGLTLGILTYLAKKGEKKKSK